MPIETIKTKHDIFISYRRNGGLELAEKIYDALCDKFAPFFDKNSMRSGDFDKQIYTAIEECEDFILILSPNALDERESEHDWMRIEIKYARDNGKNIIPIAFEDFKFPEILPDEIKEINRLQQICYTGDDAKLVDNVKNFLCRYKDGRVLAEYAESMYATYNKIKFLNQELPHDKLFVDLHLIYFKKEKDIETKQIIEREYTCDSAQLLKTAEPCVLIGTAGSGKSSIARNLLLNETRMPDTLEYVPIFIELPKLSEQLSSRRSIQDFISDVSGFNSYELRYIDKSGKKLFLILDGMDEILSSEMLDDVIEATERFFQDYTNTKLIFTSRPACMKIKDRNTFSIDGHEIKKFFVEELTEDERKEQIDRIIGEAFPELNRDKFWADLAKLEGANYSITDITKNPLLLSLMLSVYHEDSVDGGERGSFPNNKVELYERSVKLIIKDRPGTRVKYLSNELIPLTVTLLGRIAYTLYEELQKSNLDGMETVKISENLIRQGVKSYIAYTLKCSQDNATAYAEEFIAFIKERAIFIDNKFLHETFKEYFAALFLYSTLFSIYDTPFGLRIKPSDEKLFDEKINSFSTNENTSAVIEMLLCYIDRETPDNETAVSTTLDKILDNCLTNQPKYEMLCKAVGQFLNHHTLGATKLIVSMFKRGCEKVVNPFAELFWYMSEYNIKAGITDHIKDPIENKNTDGLDKAHDYIAKEYVDDQQKLAIAKVCYHLYRFLYIDVESAWDDCIEHKKQLNEENGKMINKWWNASDSAFCWIQKEGNIDSDGNLLYFNSSAKGCRGGLKNIRFIKLDINNNELITDGLTVYSKDKTILHHHIRKGYYSPEFVLPDSVTKIAPHAFSHCARLTKINIPDSVVEIGNDVFSCCANLKSVILSKSITEIKYSTFLNCEMLESINIPNSVTGIGVLAFSGCSNLQSVLLPKSLSTIKATAFAKCLKSTFIIEDNPFFSAKDGIIFNKEQTEIIAYPTACGDVSIPDTITKIKEFAFSNCSELNQVYFSGSIIIYNNAFLKCNKLENIIFSDSTFQIEFEKLEYYFVLIFNEETNFYNGYAPDLTMYAEGSTKDSVVGCLSELLIYYFELAAKHETDIPAPTSIEELKKKWKRYDVLSFPVETYRMLLGIYPFFNCNNLKSITIPKTVTKITPGMFSGNANLKIRCYQDSYAEQYAKENGISVEYITE